MDQRIDVYNNVIMRCVSVESSRRSSRSVLATVIYQSTWRPRNPGEGYSSISFSFFDYRFHPAIMDAAYHVAVHPIMTGNHDDATYFLPSRLSALRLSSTFQDQLSSTIVHAKVTAVSWLPGTNHLTSHLPCSDYLIFNSPSRLYHI